MSYNFSYRVFSTVFAKIRKLRSSVHADSFGLNKQKKCPITCSPALDPMKRIKELCHAIIINSY